MSKIAIICFYLLPYLTAQGQNELSPEGRSHWNKAQVYVEQAQTENEWRFAISELEAVVRSDPNFYNTYLLLGDAYSKIDNQEALTKARKYYRHYAELVPERAAEVRDKVDRLEAMAEINLARKRDTFFRSLVGKWSPNENWGVATRDIEFIYDGTRLLLRYHGMIFHNKDGNRSSIASTNYTVFDPVINKLICTYTTTGIWEDDDDRSQTEEKLMIPYQENIDKTIIVDVRYPTGNIFREIFHKY